MRAPGWVICCLAAATLAVTGCTTEAGSIPTASAPSQAASGSATQADADLVAPMPAPGELARVDIKQGAPHLKVSRHARAKVDYAVQAQCRWALSSALATWTLTVNGETTMSGTVRCDETITVAPVGRFPAGSDIRLDLTLPTSLSQGWAALVPQDEGFQFDLDATQVEVRVDGSDEVVRAR